MRVRIFSPGLVAAFLLLFASTAAADLVVHPSNDLSGATDQANIKAALEAEKNGGTVVLSAGTFYLHKSIVVFDFEGTFTGVGAALTTVRTAPGVDFDVSPSLDAVAGFPPARGLLPSMFLFPYNPSDNETTFNMSEMKIVVDQPAVDPPLDGFVDDRRAYLLNTMAAVVTSNSDVLNFLIGAPFGTINLDAVIQDIVVEGIQHPQFRGLFDGAPYDTDNSLFVGISVLGPNIGDVITTDVHIMNADIAINNSDNGETLIENCIIQNAALGIENFVTPTIASNNVILDTTRRSILLVDTSNSRLKQNTILTSDPDSFADQIVFAGNSSDGVIKANSISGGSTGIGVWGCSRCRVEDNSVNSRDFGIWIEWGASFLEEGIQLVPTMKNMVKHNSVYSDNTAIYLGAYARDNRLINNVAVGGTEDYLLGSEEDVGYANFGPASGNKIIDHNSSTITDFSGCTNVKKCTQVDEDSDGLLDEDPINGLDDDMDGYIDEDAQQSPNKIRPKRK